MKVRITEIIANNDGNTTFRCTNGKEEFTACGLLYMPDEKQTWNIEWADDNGICRITQADRTVWDKYESISMLQKECRMPKDIAEAVVAAYGDDIYCMRAEMRGLTEIKGIGPIQAQKIIALTETIQGEQEAWKLLREFKPYQNIIAFIRKSGKPPVQAFMDNPYVLTEYGVMFPMVDDYAIHHGVDIWDERRISATIKETIRRMHNAGHTMLEYSRFLYIASEMTKRDRDGETQIPIIVLSMLAEHEKDITIIKKDESTYIMTTTDMICEHGIAQQLERLKASRRPLKHNGYCENYNDFSDEQKKAFEILEGGVMILTGGPGTGKTTTIGGIVKSLPDPARILLCAPTGRAASRMAEASGMTAKTIHKALNLKWFLDNQAAELDYDIIIADEMSMCETELLYLFLKAIKSGTALLMTGDYNQLPSVGPGQVFRDMIESKTIRTVCLTKIMRQKDQNGIIAAADAILHGKVPEENNDLHIITATEDEIRQYAKTMDGQFMSPVKRGRCGTFAINNIIQKKKGFSQPAVMLNGFWFHEGDVVIMNENRYDIGYMNGDIGTITKIRGNIFSIQFRELLEISIADLGEMLPAYALTVHKSQGAECDEAIIVLPRDARNMASRQLIYTAITRAKKKATIIQEPNMLKRYVEAERKTIRNTGLKDQLKKAGGNVS